jgi:hypothetical protein
MDWMQTIGDILSRYTGTPGGAASAPADPHKDYSQIAASAPKEVMADALSHTFKSDQTPDFAEMVSNLFRQSNPTQQAGLLNHLIATLGPSALASIPALRGLSGSSSVTPQAASQVSADQVRQMANSAQRANPSIVEQVSGFYAQHPDVVKALGGAALAIAIQHIARRT